LEVIVNTAPSSRAALFSDDFRHNPGAFNLRKTKIKQTECLTRKSHKHSLIRRKTFDDDARGDSGRATPNILQAVFSACSAWMSTGEGQSAELSQMPEHSATLDRAFIETQRQRLEKLRQRLLGREAGEFTRDRLRQEEHGDEAHEFEEQAQGMAQHEVDQAVRDIEGRRIGNIERALQKIAEGSYGRSDQSGEAIPRSRLEATPEANLTIEEELIRERNPGG